MTSIGKIRVSRDACDEYREGHFGSFEKSLPRIYVNTPEKQA